MRRLLIACGATVMLVALPGPALAQQGSSESSGVSGGAENVGRGSVSTELAERQGAPGVSPVSSVVDDGKVWVTWLVVRDQTTDPCIGRDGQLMDPEAEDIDQFLAARDEQFGRMLTHAIMNGDDGEGCDEPAMEDPIEVVRRVVEERLPDVDIQVQPPGGRALVGWPVYLTLGRDPVFEPAPTSVSLLSRNVSVSIRATATTEVDWNDGTGSVQTYEQTRGVTWERRDEPGAMPISYQYQDVGERTITVTDTWQVEVDAAGVGQWTLTIPREAVQVPLQVAQSQSVVTAQH